MELLDVLRRSQGLGFLGPRPVELQVAHARGYLPWLPDQGSVLDLGSGGGLPGLVLLEERADLAWTLLDANERRCTFLRWAVRNLGREASVRVGRAEVLGRDEALRHRFAAVVARSFGPPALTAELGAAFLVPGGQLIVSEPPSDRDAEWPVADLDMLGLEPGSVEQVGDATYRVMTRTGDYPDALPRDERQIRKRPWVGRST